MNSHPETSPAWQKGLFRYVVLEPLLTSPPSKGDLAARLREISEREHIQPWNKKAVRLSVRTLERWYSECRKSTLPVQALIPRLRSDRGKCRVLTADQRQTISDLYRKYPGWSVHLLYDNFRAYYRNSTVPSYSTVLRYFRREGLFVAGCASKRRHSRSIRTYEVEFVGQLWHMDFHTGSRMVTTENGEFKRAICMAIIDDKSRLICHVQWFLNETAEVLVHGLCQAIAKRGIPATFYTDNGSAMKAEELVTGLEVLGIKKENTLPYAAWQNGKQESFWKPLEGRLMKMIPREKRITLDDLNILTQVWVERDYHMAVHSETGESPHDRFFKQKSVLREGLDFGIMKRCFRRRVTRKVRGTDGTVTISGVRFELPSFYRHLDTVTLRYAEWDLGEAEILCPDTLRPIATIHPLNRIANSMGFREVTDRSAEGREFSPPEPVEHLSLLTDSLPPLLARCLEEYSRENRLTGYIPLEKNEATSP